MREVPRAAGGPPPGGGKVNLQGLVGLLPSYSLPHALHSNSQTAHPERERGGGA